MLLRYVHSHLPSTDLSDLCGEVTVFPDDVFTAEYLSRSNTSDSMTLLIII